MGNIVKVIDTQTINHLINQYNMETTGLPNGTIARKKLKVLKYKFIVLKNYVSR